MQVGRAQAPDATREVEVVRIVHLREVVDRPGQLREREIVRPAVVTNLDEALFDVDVRCAVLTHRAELHEMSVRGEVADRVEHMQGADDVVRLREDRVLAILHRVGGAGHLAVMHHGVRSEAVEHRLHDVPIRQVPQRDADLVPCELPPSGDPLREPPGRGQRIGSGLLVGAAPELVVDDVDLVASSGEPHRGRPAEVAVAAQDQDAHERPFGKVRFGGLRGHGTRRPSGERRG